MRLYLLHCNCVCADFNVSRQFLAKNLKGNRNKKPLSRKISGNKLKPSWKFKKKKKTKEKESSALSEHKACDRGNRNFPTLRLTDKKRFIDAGER